MSNKIEKKQILPNSAIPVAEGVEGVDPLKPKKYEPKKDIKAYGLAPTELFEFKDPISGEKKSIMIDRRGSTEQSLGAALLDPKISKDQKDSMVSMYLFEKGKQGASMLMDLLMYKGAHTKESRQFQSTMRFDFELFLQTWQIFLKDAYDLIWNNLPLEKVEVDGKTIVKVTRDVDANELAVVMGELGNYFTMTGDLLGKRIRAEVQKREQAKGKGIYIGADNKPYSIYEDGDIVEVVAKDKAEADKEKDGTD